jgi:DNA-binding beta-propeller fold protein YncE
LDGIGNIYIDENYQDVRIYSASVNPADSIPLLVGTYTPGLDVFSVATHDQFFAWGSVTVAYSQTIDGTLAGDGVFPTEAPANTALALAYDLKGNLYYCNTNGAVDYLNFASDTVVTFASPGFTCEGVVVDNARQRVYLSNQQGNSIAVYSTSGTLLKTIE